MTHVSHCISQLRNKLFWVYSIPHLMSCSTAQYSHYVNYHVHVRRCVLWFGHPVSTLDLVVEARVHDHPRVWGATFRPKQILMSSSFNYSLKDLFSPIDVALAHLRRISPRAGCHTTKRHWEWCTCCQRYSLVPSTSLAGRSVWWRRGNIQLRLWNHYGKR